MSVRLGWFLAVAAFGLSAGGCAASASPVREARPAPGFEEVSIAEPGLAAEPADAIPPGIEVDGELAPGQKATLREGAAFRRVTVLAKEPAGYRVRDAKGERVVASHQLRAVPFAARDTDRSAATASE